MAGSSNGARLGGARALELAPATPVADAANALIGQVATLLERAARGELDPHAECTGALAPLAVPLEHLLSSTRSTFAGISQNAMLLSGASEELTGLGERMRQSAEETVNRATEVSVASGSLNQNIQTMSSSAGAVSNSIRDIAANANEAARFATAAVGVAKRANSTVAKLGEISTEIAKIIKVITSVAQQTNLLALNATIEAARAGAAGRGFAVVANEVKELAKETTRATDEISLQIERINADTRGAVSAIGEVAQIITQINALQSVIASAVQDQTNATGEITRHATEAARSSAAIAHSIQSVAATARGTTSSARDSQEAARAVASLAAELIQVTATQYERVREQDALQGIRNDSLPLA